MKFAAVSLTAAFVLSACAKGGEGNVESVTVELTTETSVEQSMETTEQTTAF